MLKVFARFPPPLFWLQIGQSMWGVNAEKFRVYQHFFQPYLAELSLREKDCACKSVTVEAEERGGT